MDTFLNLPPGDLTTRIMNTVLKHPQGGLTKQVIGTCLNGPSRGVAIPVIWDLVNECRMWNKTLWNYLMEWNTLFNPQGIVTAHFQQANNTG